MICNAERGFNRYIKQEEKNKNDKEIMENMELQDIIKQEITEINELLYQQNIAAAYPRLAQVLPKLEQYTYSLDEETRNEWLGILQSALEAMEQNDATLLADILEYEILERIAG